MHIARRSAQTAAGHQQACGGAHAISQLRRLCSRPVWIPALSRRLLDLGRALEVVAERQVFDEADAAAGLHRSLADEGQRLADEGLGRRDSRCPLRGGAT